MKKVNSPRLFTGFDVATDLLRGIKDWPVTKDHPIATGFVEAGIGELISFNGNGEVNIGPIVDAIASGLRLVPLEPW